MTREEKMLKRRRQAVLETALARDVAETEPLLALDHATVALKLLPDFVPAALIAARIQIDRGETRRAMSLFRRVWRATSHPHAPAICQCPAGCVGGGSAEAHPRAHRLRAAPSAGRGGAGPRCVDAFDWVGARNALADYSAAEPTQAVCLLMAEIEEGQNADQGKAREWLSRAVRAPADPVWIADGITSDEWEPVSPITGRLDAFEWRVPVATVQSRGEALPALPANLPPPDGQTSLAPNPTAQ